MSLTGKQRRHLRAIGHHLQAVVLLGKGGIDAGVADAAAQALLDHELIKVKLPEDVDRDAMAEELATRVKAEVAQVLGRTALLYKRREHNPGIKLPGAPEGPAVGEVQREAKRLHTKGPSMKALRRPKKRVPRNRPRPGDKNRPRPGGRNRPPPGARKR